MWPKPSAHGNLARVVPPTPRQQLRVKAGMVLAHQNDWDHTLVKEHQKIQLWSKQDPDSSGNVVAGSCKPGIGRIVCCVEQATILLANIESTITVTIANKKLFTEETWWLKYHNYDNHLKLLALFYSYTGEHLSWRLFRTLQNKERPYTDPRYQQSNCPPGVMPCVGFLLCKNCDLSAPNYTSAKLYCQVSFLKPLTLNWIKCRQFVHPSTHAKKPT